MLVFWTSVKAGLQGSDTVIQCRFGLDLRRSSGSRWCVSSSISACPRQQPEQHILQRPSASVSRETKQNTAKHCTSNVKSVSDSAR